MHRVQQANGRQLLLSLSLKSLRRALKVACPVIVVTLALNTTRGGSAGNAVNFTTTDVPGAVATACEGINSPKY